MKFRLQNRYQDSGWEDLDGEEFYNLDDAVFRAAGLSCNSICYGMVRVVDDQCVVVEFPAGVMPELKPSKRIK